jgi:hypothetical protein
MSVLGLSNKARIITPQLAETERNRWFVGTFSSTNKVSEIDKIILIDFDEDIDEITTLNFNFSTPITSISPNPKEKSLFIVTGVDHCALYRLPELPNEPFRSDNFELEKVFDIPTDTVDHIIG